MSCLDDTLVATFSGIREWSIIGALRAIGKVDADWRNRDNWLCNRCESQRDRFMMHRGSGHGIRIRSS